MGLPELLPFEAKGVKRYQWIVGLGLERTYSRFEIVLEYVALSIGQILLIDICVSVNRI